MTTAPTASTLPAATPLTIAEKLFPFTLNVPGLDGALSFWQSDTETVLNALQRAVETAEEVALPLTRAGETVAVQVDPVNDTPRFMTFTVAGHAISPAQGRALFTATQLTDLLVGEQLKLHALRWRPAGLEILDHRPHSAAQVSVTSYAQVFKCQKSWGEFTALVKVHLGEEAWSSSVLVRVPGSAPVEFSLPVAQQRDWERTVLVAAQSLLSLAAALVN